jgi:hypothetical protein
MRLRPRQRDGFVKRSDVADVMIAGTDQQYLILIGQQRCKRDRGSAVALHWFEDDARASSRHSAELRLLRLVGDNDGRGKGIAKPLERLLEQVSLADQRDEMLGPFRRRQGPQPGPRTARQNDRTDRPSPLGFAHDHLHADNGRRTPAFTISL